MQLYNCSLKNKSFSPRTWEAEAKGEVISVSSRSTWRNPVLKHPFPQQNKTKRNERKRAHWLNVFKF